MGTCSHANWAGDGFCDDGNNNCACDWDHGDCCGDGNNYNQCDECRCLDPSLADLTTGVPGFNQPVASDVTGELVTENLPNPPPTDIVLPGGGGANTPQPPPDDAHSV